MSDERAEELREEALRIYGRYQREFVEKLGLCPWAVRSREEGHVEVMVLLDEEEDALAPALEAIADLAAIDTLEVGLLVFPCFAHGRRDHEIFAGKLRERHAARHGGSPPFAMAAFHPVAEPDLGHSARLVPFIRRSPDPTIQLVRRTALDGVRRRTGDRGTAFMDLRQIDIAKMLSSPPPAPLHQRVAESNRETIAALGVAEAQALLDAIEADRNASYARLAAKG